MNVFTYNDPLVLHGLEKVKSEQNWRVEKKGIVTRIVKVLKNASLLAITSAAIGMISTKLCMLFFIPYVSVVLFTHFAFFTLKAVAKSAIKLLNRVCNDASMHGSSEYDAYLEAQKVAEAEKEFSRMLISSMNKWLIFRIQGGWKLLYGEFFSCIYSGIVIGCLIHLREDGIAVTMLSVWIIFWILDLIFSHHITACCRNELREMAEDDILEN